METKVFLQRYRLSLGRNGLAVGSKVTLSTMIGDKAFTVRGIMRSRGLTSAFGGNLAVMDIYAAQQVLGRRRRFDRNEPTRTEGTPVDPGTKATQDPRGPRPAVQAPYAGGHCRPWYSKYPRNMPTRSASADAEGCARMKSLPPVSPTSRGYVL